jgi:lipopolysaccharide transport system permease protein
MRKGFLLKLRKGVSNLKRYRYFLYQIIKTKFVVRYAQSLLGVVWVVLEPMLLVITLSVIFTVIGRRGLPGVPFALFFYSGVLIWRIFAESLTQGTRTFIEDRSLLRKIDYPRWLSLLSRLSVTFLDFIFANVAFICLLVYYRVNPTINWLYIPAVLGLQLFISFSIMLIFATINVYVRDIGRISGVLSTIWFFFSGIIFYFPYEGKTKLIFYINPIVGIIHSYRRIILFGEAPMLEQLYCAFAACVVFFTVGIVIYRKYSRNFLDVL